MNKVAEKIISEAQKNAQKISEDSLARINELTSAFQLEIQKTRDEQSLELKKIYNAEKNRLESLERMEEKNSLLSRKRELINDISIYLKNKISEDENLYRDYLTAVIKTAVKTGHEQIICSAEDRVIFAGQYIQSLNSFAEEKGLESGISLSDERLNNQRGVILRDDRMQVNLLVDTVLDYHFHENMIELSEILFGENS